VVVYSVGMSNKTIRYVYPQSFTLWNPESMLYVNGRPQVLVPENFGRGRYYLLDGSVVGYSPHFLSCVVKPYVFVTAADKTYEMGRKC